MTNKQISISDLNEQFLDELNGINALITALAEKVGMTDEAVKDIQHKASAAGKREQAEVAQRLKDMEAFLKDKKTMQKWVWDSHYICADAKEWAKAAEVQWQIVLKRSGSEHGKAHDFSYKEPTEAELFKKLDEFGGWAKSTDPQYAGHRARAQKVLPHIKKKLAALLVA